MPRETNYNITSSTCRPAKRVVKVAILIVNQDAALVTS